MLSLYPNGAPIPSSSTLNADDLAVGIVNALASSATHLILDVSGYFAP